MEIIVCCGCPYEDREGEVTTITCSLEKGETLRLGDMLKIELMDDTVIERQIKVINPVCAGDYRAVSEKTAKLVQEGKYSTPEPVLSVTGPCSAEFVVTDIPEVGVKTKDETENRKWQEEHSEKLCIFPFKELHSGDESIYNHVQEGYTVPQKVIEYLQSAEPYYMSLGIYEHPFKKDIKLSGPYTFTDGHYWWDRDTWKYVVKYHVTLPREFIDYVMSDAGTLYLNKFAEKNSSWSDIIEGWKNSENSGLCLLPDNAGDSALEDF